MDKVKDYNKYDYILKDHPSINPTLLEKTHNLIQDCKKEGLNVFIVESLRSYERQEKLYSIGRVNKGNIVTNARGGYSWHNFGLAVDIVFLDKNGAITKDSWDNKHNWKRLGELGKKQGLTWGGDFRVIRDYPHFQLNIVETLKDCRDFYKSGGLNNVWKNIKTKE